ncbi:unnamed protein product [Peronospora belbahrii]|uniref:Uncharacterized protein n=1 Tax=Peronospora belbahrii TaxID=622444 RepID=A0AAU9LAW8_9STRA|nr:unnamed protein product [Peronospora belbahrii]CAH0522664.1 unnamed protein product [Peronospora belbahrii]
MDAQRALLDSLMGLNRDGDRPNEATLDYTHPKVCKLYLCGLCPRELFQHTRLDSGACDFLHIPALRVAFQEEQVVKRDFDYEQQLANELSKMLVDVEKKITRAQKRLDENGEENQERIQILELTKEMQDATSLAEQATKEGHIDKSMQLMEHVELLKRKRREVLRQNNVNSNATGVAMMVENVNQKLRVCDVCGAFLSIFDSDRRLADHFGGKVHVGYVQIRKKLKELMDKRNADKKEDKPKRWRPVDRLKRDEHLHRRRESRPERSRVDDRERPRDRDRVRRSRERRRHRDRSHGRSHRRRRSKSSSRSPERKQSRSHRHRH